jgi:hypothetical protein
MKKITIVVHKISPKLISASTVVPLSVDDRRSLLHLRWTTRRWFRSGGTRRFAPGPVP